MKKYLLLFFVTVVIILGITNIPKLLMGNIASVSLTTVLPSRAESTVICSGKIEYSEVNNIYVDNTSIIESVNVKIGDTVNKGDVIFKVSGAIENPSTQKNFSSDLNSLSNISDIYNYMLKNEKENHSINKNYVTDNNIRDIKSPYDGVVSDIPIKEKDVVLNGNCICSIANKNKLQVKTGINESQISEVKLGQLVFISGLGFKNSEYAGKVAYISNEAKQINTPSGQETVVDVIISINSPKDDVKPGFTARCKIVIEEKEGIIIIPYESVNIDKNKQAYVYVLKENIARKTFISTGREFENGIEVTSGLNFDDQVISDSEKVFNGEKLIPMSDSEG